MALIFFDFALLNSFCLISTSFKVDIPTSYLSLESLKDSLLNAISLREEIIFSSFNLRFKYALLILEDKIFFKFSKLYSSALASAIFDL